MRVPEQQTDLVAYDDVRKIWHRIAKFTTNDNFSFELEVHKYLLNIFQPGDFYYFVFNCGTAEMEYVSDSITSVLGIAPSELTLDYLFTIIHPEDLPYFLDFEEQVTRFFNQLPPEKVLKYKVSYDYRIRAKDGSYKRMLQQAVTIQSNENGAVIRVIDVHTDITHLKKENGSSLSFIGLDGEPSFHNCSISKPLQIRGKAVFTRKEKEVLQLLASGMTSQDIADQLFISKQTVDKHRKNMLAKSGHKNTVELVSYALKESWL